MEEQFPGMREQQRRWRESAAGRQEIERLMETGRRWAQSEEGRQEMERHRAFARSEEGQRMMERWQQEHANSAVGRAMAECGVLCRPPADAAYGTREGAEVGCAQQ